MTKTIILFLALLVSTVSLVTAKSGYMEPMKTRYSIPDGSKLDACTTCHSGTWSRNSYGSDLEDAGIKSNIVAAFAATDAVDSDNDGADNQTELIAGTWPGDNSDIAPVADATWGRIKALFN